MQISKPTEIQ